jgi:hypothetical protein
LPQAGSSESNLKYSHIPDLNEQTLSNSTDESRFLFESFSSTPKQEDNISTTSLPSTPTVAIHDPQVKTWSDMPAPLEITADLVSTCPVDHHHIMSSGSSSASSVCKDETRSVGGSSTKQRKRKERRDSLSDEHDKKLSRSSGCIIDDLSSIPTNKVTGCNLLIKQSTSSRRKQQHIGQTNTEFTSAKPTLVPKCDSNLQNRPTLLKHKER